MKLSVLKLLPLFLGVVCCSENNTLNKDEKPFKLTVIVLTMNRPWSLARLLKSLENTDLESENDKFDVEIHVDKSVGEHYNDCVRFARNFTAPNGGKVTPVIFEKNHGLRAAWFEAWYPKPDDEYAIIIEDDLEVSPFWYTWLKKAWSHFGDRDDIAGIALQRQYMMFKKPQDRSDMEIINDYQPFLYKLVGTWAFAPHPKKWREFLDWFNSVDNVNFDPYVPGLVTSDWLHIHTNMNKRHMTWEQWHIYYSEHHGLYTMYLNLPQRKALCANWREAGVHNRQSFNEPDYKALDYCAIQLQEFPEKLRKYDWDTMEILEPGDPRTPESGQVIGLDGKPVSKVKADLETPECQLNSNLDGQSPLQCKNMG